MAPHPGGCGSRGRRVAALVQPVGQVPIANRPKYRAIRRAGHKLDPMGVLRFASSEACAGAGGPSPRLLRPRALVSFTRGHAHEAGIGERRAPAFRDCGSLGRTRKRRACRQRSAHLLALDGPAFDRPSRLPSFAEVAGVVEVLAGGPIRGDLQAQLPVSRVAERPPRPAPGSLGSRLRRASAPRSQRAKRKARSVSQRHCGPGVQAPAKASARAAAQPPYRSVTVDGAGHSPPCSRLSASPPRRRACVRDQS